MERTHGQGYETREQAKQDVFDGNARAHDMEMRLEWTLPAGWSVVPLGRAPRENSGAVVNVGALDPRQARTYRYLIRAPESDKRVRPDGTAVEIAVRGEVTSRSYGEIYSANNELRHRLPTGERP